MRRNWLGSEQRLSVINSNGPANAPLRTLATQFSNNALTISI
jgi:hypothetical protein